MKDEINCLILADIRLGGEGGELGPLSIPAHSRSIVARTPATSAAEGGRSAGDLAIRRLTKAARLDGVCGVRSSNCAGSWVVTIFRTAEIVAPSNGTAPVNMA